MHDVYLFVANWNIAVLKATFLQSTLHSQPTLHSQVIVLSLTQIKLSAIDWLLIICVSTIKKKTVNIKQVTKKKEINFPFVFKVLSMQS